MMPAPDSRRTVVARVRIRGNVADPLLARLRIESALGSASLAPAGLPPSAILLVRKIADPLLGRLGIGHGGPTVSPEWEQAVRNRLAVIATGAARPARGFVSPSADAVVFADQSELLASLASDWCDGSAITRWWWQSLFPRTDARQLLIKAWTETPEYIPAALHQLAKRRDVQRVIHAIQTVEVQTLRQILIRTFGLGELQIVFGSSRARPMTNENPRAQTNSFHSDQRTFETLDVSFWKRWAPEASREDLTVEQTSFLAIGLMLYRAPAIVRSLAFSRAVERSYGQASHWEAERRSRRRSEGRFVDGRDSVERPIILDSKTTAKADTLDQAMEREKNSVLPIHRARDEFSSTTRSPTLHTPQPQLSSQTVSTSVEGVPDQIEADNPFVAGEVSTSFGGLFYFINVGLFLELYSDFTSPLRPGLTLPIWDFIALLGERILGPSIKSDPVWSLLVRLAGPDEQGSPGADFEPLDDWRMPISWLKPFSGKGEWCWSGSGGRLRVWHPEGFCVLDLPSEVEPNSEQVQSELQSYEETGEVLRADLEPLPSQETPLERWLGWIVPYLRARLARALGVAVDAAWPALLMSHEARVLVSDARLDVIFSLQRHPFEIRASGLDRDPGWVPAAGRFIAFHFE
jgi:hypothetical protein